MALLARYRRIWFLAFTGLLALPMLVQVLQPSHNVSEGEARTLAPRPNQPHSLAEWLQLPRVVDRYLADHFGLREPLVRAHGILRYAIVLPSNLGVIVGRDKWLFFNGDAMMQQSTGLLLRQADVDKFADYAALLHARFAARNISFLVTAPPNSATIMRAKLPAWAAEKPAITEYDLMMKALAARSVPAVDLRPVLLSENSNNPVYRQTDTHWNKLGALIAYNAVVAGLRRPDWLIDQTRVFRGFERVAGGDLARMLAVSANVTDVEARIDLSAYAPRPLAISALDTHFESGGDIVETGRKGPTVLVLGDSFTQNYWRDYFALHAGRLVWMHHEYCGFSLDIVDAQKPDIVILAPTERVMFCWARK